MINDLFQDEQIVKKIQSRLPELFQLAELESSRAGKIGMEVGSMREKILIALLIYKFGRAEVRTDLPIHEPETDVIVSDNPISIKTMTGKHIGGVKVIWTVDREQALTFSQNYSPSCDMLFVHINWGGTGGMYLFTQELQASLMEQIGRENYIKLPKPGTNPRGVEISRTAMRMLSAHPKTMKIPIRWERKTIPFDPYQRWLELWEQD